MKTLLMILCLLIAPFAHAARDGGATTMPQDSVVLCGQNFNTTTGYIGPAPFGAGLTDMGGTVCNGLDSTTEGTADDPVQAQFPAFMVTGFACLLSSDPVSDVVITARSAVADMSPSLTCTVTGAGTDTGCSTTAKTTTDVAIGATIALKVVTLENLSTQDLWCKMYIILR